MNRLRLQSNLEDITYLTKTLDDFKRQANTFIQKFKKVLDDNKLSTSEIVDNSLDFNFWGLKFIIKSEIQYSQESHDFIQGELNTYLLNDEEMILILTSYFDKLGNVGRISVIKDFAEYYFIDFVENIKKITSEREIKFQLK
jgi:hypothetical protein